MTILGLYTKFAALKALPALVRKQRRLEAAIAAANPALVEEGLVRKAIDTLLVTAGVTKSEAVLCLGYEVAHHERAGSARLNQDALVERLVAGGVDRAFVLEAIEASTERGEPSSFATVKPAKGAKVRS